MFIDLVAMYDHAGKIRSEDEFTSFWRLFTYLFVGIVISVVASEIASSFLAGDLLYYFAYIVGITAGMVGTFLSGLSILLASTLRLRRNRLFLFGHM